MTTYFANTFSANGIVHSIPPWDSSYQILLVRGVPQSSVTIFIDDLVNDLKLHDIPVSPYASCIYPDTPDILIIPSLKRVILNGNNLTSLLKDLLDSENPPVIEDLDLTQFCNPEMLDHYRKEIAHLEEKMCYYQQEGFQFLGQIANQPAPTSAVTPDMLFLLQSLFPVTAENMGRPEKVLATSLTSSGWLSNLQGITADLKRRYILHGSPTFLRTLFQLAETRAHNLNIKCFLLINPLFPEQVEGIVFPDEQQAILLDSKQQSLVPGVDDIELFFDHDEELASAIVSYDNELKLAMSAFIKAHSFREEMDEYYWYTADLELFFMQRRRVMHQLLALCDGQELWQYFV